MFVVLLAFYVVSSAFKVRVDITEDKAHTLSPGTKHILAKLDAPVTLRFYCTQGDNAMPPAFCASTPNTSKTCLPNTSRPARAKSSSKNWIPSPTRTPRIPPGSTASKAAPPGSSAPARFTSASSPAFLIEKFALPWLSARPRTAAGI